jgi:hypothetical protein
MSTEATQGMGADVADLESMFNDEPDDSATQSATQNQGQQGTQAQQNGEDDLVLDEHGNPVDPAIVVDPNAEVEVELDENGDPIVDVDPNAPPVELAIPDDHKVKLTIDGKEVEYTFGDLKAGVQKAVAADKRFEEAAAIRKEYTEKAQTIHTREQQLGQVLEFYINQSQQLIQAQQPDWNKLLEENPTEYVRQRHAWDLKQAEMAQARQVQANVARQQAEHNEASRQQNVAEQYTKLKAAIPEWSDPKKAAEGAQAIDTYLKAQGIHPNVLAQVDSAEVLLVARKAMLYDQAMARATARKAAGGTQAAAQTTRQPAVANRQQGVRQQSRVERPGAANTAQSAASRQNLSRANATKAFNANPSVDTLAALFE